MPSETPEPTHCQLYGLFAFAAVALRPRPEYCVFARPLQVNAAQAASAGRRCGGGAARAGTGSVS